VSEARVSRLLPLACLIAAVVLFASELMTMFEFTPPGGEPLDSQSAGERHGNAMFVIAPFAIGALGLAVLTGSKPAAVAVGVMGVIALLFFLLGDLPDVNQIGTLDDVRGSFFDAEAVPQEGFWLLMVSSLALAVTGIALATLTPEQLAALGPGRAEAERTPDSRRRAGRGSAASSPGSGAPAHPVSDRERARRRFRSRQR
jgi:hypothetical protein